AAEADSGRLLSEMALAGMAGRVMAGTVGTGAGRARQGVRGAARAEARAISVAGATTGENDPAPQDNPRPVVTGVAAELREFTNLRDEGILTDDEYTEQKNRLLGR